MVFLIVQMMAIKTENIGWGLSFKMVCDNYWKDFERFRNRRKASADKLLSKERFDMELERQMKLRGTYKKNKRIRFL